jgi:hypothetical protein
MRGNIALVLALLGIGCFVYVFAWLVPESKSLLVQNDNLITLSLFEEASQYQNEAMELSKWIVPVAVLGCFLLIPINIYFIARGVKKHAQK